MAHTASTVRPPGTQPPSAVPTVTAGTGTGPGSVKDNRKRHARNVHGLTVLFEERQEMRGVSRVADFFADSFRWSV